MKKNLIEAAIKAKIINVRISGWNVFRDLRVLNPEVKSAEWLNYRAEKPGAKPSPYAYALPNFQQETSYQDCIQFTYSLVRGELDVLMHDGDSLNGYPTHQRCRWVLAIDPSSKFFKEYIVPVIENHMKHRAEEIFAERERKRMDNEIAEILKDLYK